MFPGLAAALPFLRTGRMRALAITGTARNPLLPDVPSMADAVPNFSFDLWWGVFAPGNMPRDLVTRLNTEVNKALQSAAIKKFAETEGVTPGTLSADQFAKVYANEIKEWEALGKKTKISLD